MSKTRRLIVIGGDAAGMSAASQARRLQGPSDLEIIAFERGLDTSYSACGIPYWIGDLVADRDALIARPPEEFRERQHIDVRTRTLVNAIDTAQRTVHVTDLDQGRHYSERYDELVIATGGVPFRPPVPGIDGAGVFGVHTLGDGADIRDELATGRVTNVVIIGAGYIGLETAEAMSARGLAVTVVDQAPTSMTTLDPDMGEFIAEGLREANVGLVLDDGVAEILLDGNRRVRGVRTRSGQELPADLAVLGLGV